MREKISFLIVKIKKGLGVIPSFSHIYKRKKYKKMEMKELFRATCYMLVSEKSLTKSEIQRKFGVNYNDATFVFNLLLENNLIKAEYKSNITDLDRMEKLLDKLFK